MRWNVLSTQTDGTNVRDTIYWRAAASSDPTSWTWAMSSSQKASGAVTAYSGANTSAPIFATGTVSGTNLTAPSVTTTVTDSIVLAVFGVKTGTTITPVGQTERWDIASSGGNASTRTTSEGAEKAQPSVGASGARTATAAASVTGVAHSLVIAPGVSQTTVKYGFSAPGDTPDITMNGSGAVTERHHAIMGGVLLTKRHGGDVWNYPNIHGDIVATADAAGNKQGSSRGYDPYSENLGSIPDNSNGAYDYGWLGQHHRATEHQQSVIGLEMGARIYIPGLGRFLEVDPVDGGSANDYDYVAGDPCNNLDLDRKEMWRMIWGVRCSKAGSRFRDYMTRQRRTFERINSSRDIPLSAAQQWNIVLTSGYARDMLDYCGGDALKAYERMVKRGGR